MSHNKEIKLRQKVKKGFKKNLECWLDLDIVNLGNKANSCHYITRMFLSKKL